MKNTFRRRIYYKLFELQCYLSYFFKSDKAGEKLVIFAQGRTGSSLLESLLCSTGHFSQTSEPFNVKRKGEVWFPRIFIEGYSKMVNSPNFLFHVKCYQLTEDRAKPYDPHKLLKALEEKGWKIIYLKRENKFLHALSCIIMQKRGKSNKKDDKKEKLNLFLDLKDLEKRINTRIKYDKNELDYLKGTKFKEVIYEEDLLSTDAQNRTVKDILNWLNLEYRKPHTPYKKVNAAPLSSQISNYDDLVEFLKEKNWTPYIEQETNINQRQSSQK